MGLASLASIQCRDPAPVGGWCEEEHWIKEADAKTQVVTKSASVPVVSVCQLLLTLLAVEMTC